MSRAIGRVKSARGSVRSAVVQTVEQLESRTLLTGVLTVTPGASSGDTNLTTEGTLDWIHLGYSGDGTRQHNRFGQPGPRISVVTALNGGVFTTASTPGKTFTWTDSTAVGDVTTPTDPLTGVPDSGNLPNEGVANIINNNTNKYLNFAKFNTGFVVTPAADLGTGTVINGIRLYTANDTVGRDPASYLLEGSNDGGATFVTISSGALALPAGRNATGAALNPATQNQQTVNFANTASFKTYRLTFPTIKDPNANSMQIAEVELLNTTAENATATADASSITGDGSGFHFTVPASPVTRRVKVYVGADGSGTGTLTATLSDGSAAPATQVLTDTNAAGATLSVYTIDFKSDTASQTLSLDWVAGGGGTVILSAADWAAIPTTGGLAGSYYEAAGNARYDRDQVSGGFLPGVLGSNTKTGTRTDPRIDFLNSDGDGTEQGPFNGAFGSTTVTNYRIGGTGLADDQLFTARWEGLLHITQAGDYLFYTRSDDGVRLAVNGNLVIDQWAVPRGAPTLANADVSNTGTPIHFEVGDYPILLDYNQIGGGGGVGLYWSSDAGTTRTIINDTNLLPTVNAITAASAADTLTVSAVHGLTADLSWADHSNNEARFRIEQSTDGGTTWIPIKAVGPHSGSSGTVTTTIFNLNLNTNYRWRVVTLNASGDGPIPASAQMSADVNTGTVTNGPGVIAQYVNNTTAGQANVGAGEPWFGEPVVVTRIDPLINFSAGGSVPGTAANWADGNNGSWGSPNPGTGAGFITINNFSSRYSGKIHIVTGGTYTFRVNSDDASHAWVNGQLVSDYPGAHGAANAAVNTPITLAPGDYAFDMVQCERGGGAAAQFYYNGPDSGNVEALVPGQTTAGGTGLIASSDPVTAPAFTTPGLASTSINVKWNDLSLNEYQTLLEMSSDGGVTWTIPTGGRFIVIANIGGAPAAASLTINGLTPDKDYQFRLTESNFAGDVVSGPVTYHTVAAPAGQLTGTTTNPATGDTNLTTEGNLDWVHIGFPNNATKQHTKNVISGPRLGAITVIGAATPTATTTGTKTFTWTDATIPAPFDITSPTDPTVLVNGVDDGDGAAGPPPAAETVDHSFDNAGQKYLNFLDLGSGVQVTPANNTPAVNGIRFYTANDAEERDPASYVLEGSNDGGTTWATIANGPLALPSGRNPGGAVAIDPTTQFNQLLTFTNTTTYQTYRVTFPTLKNAGVANSMQIGEIELLSIGQAENAAATNNASAVTGNGNGFHINVPAIPITRRVRVYVAVDSAGGGTGGTGTLTATLTDGSALPFTATLTDANATGPQVAVYQLDFKSGLANQTLGIDWVAGNGGTAIISAVDLIEITVPAAPTAPVAVATGKGKANVSFTDNSINETGFKIERAPDVAGAPGTYVVAGNVGTDVTQFVDSGLTDGTKYWYRVSSVNAAGSTLQTGSAVNVTTRTLAVVGVRGRYWQDPSATSHLGAGGDAPVVIRNDPLDTEPPFVVNEQYGNGAPPNTTLGVDRFSIQWDGTYIADYTGAHTFFTNSDDGERLFLDVNQNGAFDYDPAAAGTVVPNGELIVNSWVDQGTTLASVATGRGIVVNLVAGQEYKFRVQYYENGGGAVAQAFLKGPFDATQQSLSKANFELPDPTPPKVTSVEVDRKLPTTATYTSAQHIAVHFSEGVTGSNTALAIVQTLDGGGTGNAFGPADLIWTYDAASNTGIITVQPASGGELPDGNYRLTLTASGITDGDGNALDGNGDGTGGDDFTYNFYILKGDTQAAYNGNFNGDRKISFIEYQRLELNYGKTSADRVSAAEGDFTHDGVIDDQDVKWFFDHNGNTLPPPAPSAPVGAPAPAPVPVTTTTTPVKKVTKPAPKPAPKPVAKPVSKPVSKPVLVAPPKTTFATKKIAGVKDLLSSH